MRGGAGKSDFATGRGDGDFGGLRVSVCCRTGYWDRAIAGGTLIDPIPFASQIDVMRM